MNLTTEAILTHPDAFAIPASPLQRAWCRISDGLPLGDLADDPIVQESVGGPDALRALPTDGPPSELHMLAAIRTFKSLFVACKIVQASQTVDVSGCSIGDIIRFAVLATKMENTRPIMSHLVETGLHRPLLRPLFVAEPTLNGAVLRHPSGRRIEVTPMPLDRAGASIQSTWLNGAAFDEEPRMIGAEDGVKNWDHAHDGVPGRLLPRGQCLGIGAPHAPFGPVYDLFQEFFGRPSRDLVLLRGRGPDLNPSWWTPKRCESLRRTNYNAYRTDVLCEWRDVETGLLTGPELDAITRESPLELPPEKGRIYVGSIDPTGHRNAFTLTLATVDQRGEDRITRIVLARQWMPIAGRLDPERVFREIADICRPYGVTVLHSDQFAIDSNRVIARNVGLTLVETVITASVKLSLFEELRNAIAREHFEMGPDPVVRSDLLSVRKRVTQAGVAIHLPSTSDGRHADYAPAIALVHSAASRAGTDDTARTVRCVYEDRWGGHVVGSRYDRSGGGRGFF